MNTTIYKGIEFLIIFILLPISFAIDYSIKLKMGIGIIGFIYIIYVLLRVEKKQFKMAPNLKWRIFWKQTILKLAVIAILTTLFVWLTDSKLLFNVLINKPKLWLFILFIYSFFSVYPQEIIYRTFYFQRYKDLFKNEVLFIFVNAIIFSLGHIFFKNSLVIVLTFFGGVLFAITYKNTQSTLLVSLEHAIYGCWLFTVGMGGMLGFPA
ncbi:CPBP family intramembrane glutamic endopeptidase [Flavivirga abyssicola]|uniref:CPBP family intramembrane glutamic endopeptidase n=1 Tax=Flavivirga abyssicola TaxID=3063533 RepID=UPI0026DF4115|nr:CPBP family intramembrane glutamic endopeptidase [Flavivirga sp. MEBiC07777]WVK12692.1 CPBP family intramembrane glutamic endopeptidase [Flavivirga sp. MEBiC07777]